MIRTAAQMKELDRIAIEDRGIPSTVLMENAAGKVAEEILAFFERSSGFCFKGAGLDGSVRNNYAPKVALFIGSGNNGGDGTCIARLLMENGFEVLALLCGNREKMTADNSEMEVRLMNAGGVLADYEPEDMFQRDFIHSCDMVVDALFGVGLNREISGKYTDIIGLINSLKEKETRSPYIISCDIPSGINADSGEVMGCAVRADKTVTFTCGKPGLFAVPGIDHAGELVIADIGIPEDLKQFFDHIEMN